MFALKVLKNEGLSQIVPWTARYQMSEGGDNEQTG